MYLTHDEYKSKGGTLTETAFNRFEFKAEKKIDYFTQGRVKEADISVKWCVFELIKLFSSQSDSGADVSSASNDGYSVSYAVSSDTEGDKAVKDIIDAYIPHLCWRGVNGK